jgi:mutator protein MutT
MMGRTRLEVVAAVIVRAGHVLVAQRLDDAHMGGLWEFPGGKVEAGETHEESLARELMEELGIRVVVREQVTRIEHDYPDRSVVLHFYRAEILDNDEPKPIECAAVRWVTPEELATLPMPPADVPLVEMLARRCGIVR